VKEYDAVALAASAQALEQLLNATLEHKFQPIGGAGAVHFAGKELTGWQIFPLPLSKIRGSGSLI
jgi:hypothetical protein